MCLRGGRASGALGRPGNIQELDMVIVMGAFQFRITYDPHGNTSRQKTWCLPWHTDKCTCTWGLEEIYA